MNNVYFACRGCLNYVDAGYRWAISTLLPDPQSRYPLEIDANGVLSHVEYWGGEAVHPHLAQTLPAARRFLLAHASHDLVFGDTESFMDFDTYNHLEWLDESSLAAGKTNSVQRTQGQVARPDTAALQRPQQHAIAAQYGIIGMQLA